jgi:hypothetical protein
LSTIGTGNKVEQHQAEVHNFTAAKTEGAIPTKGFFQKINLKKTSFDV